MFFVFWRGRASKNFAKTRSPGCPCLRNCTHHALAFTVPSLGTACSDILLRVGALRCLYRYCHDPSTLNTPPHPWPLNCMQLCMSHFAFLQRASRATPLLKRLRPTRRLYLPPRQTTHAVLNRTAVEDVKERGLPRTWPRKRFHLPSTVSNPLNQVRGHSLYPFIAQARALSLSLSLSLSLCLSLSLSLHVSCSFSL